MVDVLVEEIKTITNFFIENKEMMGGKAEQILNGQSQHLCKRLRSNRHLFLTDGTAASKISNVIKEGPWTTEQQERLAQVICSYMEVGTHTSINEQMQQLLDGFPTYWWKSVDECIDSDTATDDEKAGAIASVCAAIGLFKPSEQTCKHIMQQFIGIGVRDAMDDDERKFQLLQKVRTSSNRR